MPSKPRRSIAVLLSLPESELSTRERDTAEAARVLLRNIEQLRGLANADHLDALVARVYARRGGESLADIRREVGTLRKAHRPTLDRARRRSQRERRQAARVALGIQPYRDLRDARTVATLGEHWRGRYGRDLTDAQTCVLVDALITALVDRQSAELAGEIMPYSLTGVLARYRDRLAAGHLLGHGRPATHCPNHHHRRRSTDGQRAYGDGIAFDRPAPDPGTDQTPRYGIDHAVPTSESHLKASRTSALTD